MFRNYGLRIICLLLLTHLTICEQPSIVSPLTNNRLLQTCNSGQFYNGVRCENCKKGCLTCSSSSNCSACRESTYLKDSTCFPCSEGCSRCDESRCFACISGFHAASNTCFKCMANCSSCADATSCSRCNDGFYFDEYCKPIKAIEGKSIFGSTTMEIVAIVLIVVGIMLILFCCVGICSIIKTQKLKKEAAENNRETLSTRRNSLAPSQPLPLISTRPNELGTERPSIAPYNPMQRIANNRSSPARKPEGSKDDDLLPDFIEITLGEQKPVSKQI